MQKAYASYQFRQSMGRLSWLPAVVVHVELVPQKWRFASVGAMLTSSDANHPSSYGLPAS